ncbi:DUF411 domain-containing protein [Thalassospira sp. MA62]|nr:DUF411 domain-containing protein [Thalassospira sp. MA62]
MKHFVLASALFAAISMAPIASHAAENSARIIKNPQCGCCDMHGEYLQSNGFDVSIKDDENVFSISEMIGIPADMQGCHLTLIDGYAFSGHVPVDAINKVLAERPAARVYSLPGMPMGSPGMNGPKEEPFAVYQFENGEATLFKTY